MKRYLTFTILISIYWTIISCSGDTSEIETLYKEEDVSMEILRDGSIIYSDSAHVRLKVSFPLLERREIYNSVIEEFPEGLFVEFYEGNKSARSWLKADKGTRYPSEKRIKLIGNVELFNHKRDKLETAELNWDEEKQEISTEKFVRITQPERGDTTYGFGFVSDQHFKRFEIKRRFSGKIEESMLEDLKN